MITLRASPRWMAGRSSPTTNWYGPPVARLAGSAVTAPTYKASTPIRSHADVCNLKDELAITCQAIVIGGGYIGLEAAAVLRELGKEVVLIEALDRVLARVAGEPISRFYEAEHRAHGVDIGLETAVDSLQGRDGRVCGVRLTDGTLIECGLAIVGIGIVPAVAPLLAAGRGRGWPRGRGGRAVPNQPVGRVRRWRLCGPCEPLCGWHPGAHRISSERQ